MREIARVDWEYGTADLEGEVVWYGAVKCVTEEVGYMGNYVLWTAYKRVSLSKWLLIELQS